MRDHGGSVLPMAGAGMLMLAAITGSAIDLARVYRTQNRLQTACDAGTLAGRKAVTTNGYDSTAQTQANSFFWVNFDSTQQSANTASFASSSSDGGNTVVGTASATVPTVVMQLFKKSATTINVSCTAVEGIGNVDVTFVLDTTGSMADTPSGFTTDKITALQNSVKSFYTTMATATANTSARVRYAFVPFSSSVNVGPLLYNLNPSYLIDSYQVQSRISRMEATTNVRFLSSNSYSYPSYQEVYNSTPNSSVSNYSNTTYTTLPDCQAAEPADTAWANNGNATTSTTNNFNINNGAKYVTRTTVTQPQTQTYYFCTRSGSVYVVQKYTAYRNLVNYTYGTLTPTATTTTSALDHYDFRPVLYDMSTYKTGAAVTLPIGDNGTNVTSTWGGCIEERYTVSSSTFAYNSAQNAITPTGAIDLDIDQAPTTNATKWAPMWPELAYYKTSGSYLSTSQLTTSGTQAPSYCPNAATTLATMDSTSFNNYVNALQPSGSTYHDIGMLWGARLSSTTGIFSSIVNQAPTNGQTVSRHLILETDGLPNAAYYIQQSYGVELYDQRITDDGYTNDDNRHIARFRAICDAVKARGIRIWVIAVATSMTTDLSYCASPNSSYTAASSASLNSAFQQIAKQIGELRIYK